jgi:hypothetical protein
LMNNRANYLFLRQRACDSAILSQRASRVCLRWDATTLISTWCVLNQFITKDFTSNISLIELWWTTLLGLLMGDMSMLLADAPETRLKSYICLIDK